MNVLPEIDYERVTLMKWEYLKAVFLQSGEKTLNSSGFKEFFEANREWLEPYAAYCCLRDIYETPDFRKWKMYSVFNPDDIKSVVIILFSIIYMYSFLKSGIMHMQKA